MWNASGLICDAATTFSAVAPALFLLVSAVPWQLRHHVSDLHAPHALLHIAVQLARKSFCSEQHKTRTPCIAWSGAVMSR